jgi:hypothetical protein
LPPWWIPRVELQPRHRVPRSFGNTGDQVRPDAMIALK